MTTTQTNIVAAVLIIVASLGCYAGAEKTGLPLPYAFAWLVIVGGITHWYARRRDIWWFARKS